MIREPVLDRLDRLRGVLASRPSWTAAELAEELGVSLRTMRRDLARLGARGVPIESSPGRGGGVRVPARTGLGRVQLDVDETLDLLLALAIAEQLRSPLFLGTPKRLRQKLAAAFPAEERARVAALRRRILVGPTSRAITESWKPPRASVLRPVQQAFLEQRTLALTYVTEGARTERTVEPQMILSNWPAWYLLVWDRLRDDTRVLRLDRIAAAQVLDETFRLRDVATMTSRIGNVFAAV